MAMNGLCSSVSFELTPSVCTSLPKTGAREESGDQALPIATLGAGRTGAYRLSSLPRGTPRETGLRTAPKGEA